MMRCRSKHPWWQVPPHAVLSLRDRRPFPGAQVTNLRDQTRALGQRSEGHGREICRCKEAGFGSRGARAQQMRRAVSNPA
jgi:hypothetical protein